MKVKSDVRGKLLGATLGAFLLAGVVMLSLVAWLNDATERARSVEMEALVTKHIASKAKVLVDNHALALTGLVADNALGDIQALVQRAVEEDSDLVYGLFVGQDSEPWAYASAATRGQPLQADAVLQRWTEVPVPPEGWSSLAPAQRRAQHVAGEVFEVSRPVIEGGELLGTIRYGFSTAPLEQALASVRAESDATRQRMLLWLSLGVALSSLLGVAAITRIARHITQPLEKLTEAANAIAEGKSGVRVDVSSQDELEVLAGAFNHMQIANEDAMTELRYAMDAALEASRLKSEFLANMSHEIRTPMNGVIGMLRLILRMPLDGKLRRYAETADASASALMTIINDVLDFSKMEAGKYELQSVPFDPGVVLQEVAELLATRAHEKGLELVYHRARDVPRDVVGDPDRYRQILNNLVGNAVKFTATGGVYVEVSLDQSDGESCVLRTVVHDTGIGISEEDHAELFDAFSQVDGTMMREHGGTGLGLAISKRLTEMMNGAIGLSSERGIGSKFWFTMRLSLTGARTEVEVSAVPVGKRALVIEGSRRWCRVIEDYMGQWGLSTQIVHEGKPALRRFVECAERGEPFDVAVIGAQLTDIAIGDVVRGLRKLPGGATLPLIVLTQLGTGATLSEVEGEIAAQVAKPLRPSELYNCLLGAFGAGQAKASGHEQEVVSVQFTGLSILIVDDNHINRFVASEQVEQAGYTPVTANNGAEAVHAVKHGRFAAVLMDCQMPVMDGYTAAAEIRDWEAGGSRIPIIALTAHAMPGEREKVLTAGMDDYLSKPLRPHSLERMLKRHVQREAVPESRAEAAVSPETQGECVELSRDIPRSRKLIGLFLGQIPDQLDGLDKAMDAGDLELLAQRAHKMKGSCMALGADRMAKVAERLQHEAPNSDLAWARERVTEAHEHFAVVSGLLLGEHPSLAPPPPG